MNAAQPDFVTKVTLRSRLIAAMVLLAGLALLTSGIIVALLQHQAILENIDDQLKQTRDELRVLATNGVDPDTGDAFAGPSELLHTFLARTVIGAAEGEFAVVNGSVQWVADREVQVRPEDDEQLVDAVMPLAAGQQIVIDTIDTAGSRYRVLVAPVHYPEASGALVHVFDLKVAESELTRTMTLYAVVAVGTVLLLVGVAWVAVGRLLKPIEELRVAADSIQERDLTSRVPVRGKDDLTALSITINRMLDRVQRSVEGQRQLLDDVGHELRTPITVVRGHMELIDADDPADVRETRHLVMDEVDRMGVLVNDMLMLAKSTESDFVKPQWYDVASLTDSVLEKARALGDRAWRLDRITSTEAYLDPGRMTQAWLQLAANAVKYSDPGSPITLGSSLERGEVLMWVRDRGIGIEPDQLEVVRQRFGRTRTGAAHAQGAGLGLSIVESIMIAHGGRLDIESEPGVGSTFTLVLPLGPAPEPTQDEEEGPDDAEPTLVLERPVEL